MHVRPPAWLHAVWVSGAVLVLGASLVNPLPGQESAWPWTAGLMAFPVASALILGRRRGNVIGRALMAVGVAAMVIYTTWWYVVSFPGERWSPYMESVSTAAVIAQFVALLLLMHLFPTGRPVGPRHALLLGALCTWGVASAVLGVIRPGPMAITGRQNPLGAGGTAAQLAWDYFAVALPLFALAAVGVLRIRWRGAAAATRAQLKWFLLAAAVMVTMFVLITVIPEGGHPLAEAASGVFVVAAFWSLPAATVIAVTRHGLFEIDRIISRSAAYAIVAAVLVAFYAGSVLLLQAVLPAGSSSLGVAGSTLATAALFRPLRRRVQQALDRRFNRERYEADRVAGAFARRLRQQQALELDTVSAQLTDVVARTLQPDKVHVWLSGSPTSR